MKNGIYFDRPSVHCKNQYRMFIVDDGKISDAGIIHLALNKSPECTRKIKKYLGIHTKNSLTWTKINRLFLAMYR
jgi:hypothetical protein